jgi:hypothetical protein
METEWHSTTVCDSRLKTTRCAVTMSFGFIRSSSAILAFFKKQSFGRFYRARRNYCLEHSISGECRPTDAPGNLLCQLATRRLP